jgi:hypothetical protein
MRSVVLGKQLVFLHTLNPVFHLSAVGKFDAWLNIGGEGILEKLLPAFLVQGSLLYFAHKSQSVRVVLTSTFPLYCDFT